ncbi:hypothetical protein LXL04_000666 [Taraxacum kok-saghyz]
MEKVEPQFSVFITDDAECKSAAISLDEAFNVGDEVEVMGSEGMYKFSLYRARIVGMHGDFVDMLLWGISKQLISLKLNWLDGGLWGGIVLGGNQQSVIVYLSYKPIDSQHMNIPKTQIRIHQKWSRSISAIRDVDVDVS